MSKFGSDMYKPMSNSDKRIYKSMSNSDQICTNQNQIRASCLKILNIIALNKSVTNKNFDFFLNILKYPGTDEFDSNKICTN